MPIELNSGHSPQMAFFLRILKIFVQPFGPQYEVVLKGEVVSSGNKPLTPGSRCLAAPLMLSNKQFLAWGGVPLGRTRLQKLALRNNCTSTTQHLRLLIRGQDQDCFQVRRVHGAVSCSFRPLTYADRVSSSLKLWVDGSFIWAPPLLYAVIVFKL